MRLRRLLGPLAAVWIACQLCFLVGGPIALVQDGDIISLDAISGTLTVALSDAELAERHKAWAARETDYGSGAIWKYAQTVGSALDGAVTHPGGKGEKHCYADL